MLNQLNILLQKLTGFKLEYHGKSTNEVPGNESIARTYITDPRIAKAYLDGNVLLGKAYTRATDPCQDGNYLIGKYA